MNAEELTTLLDEMASWLEGPALYAYELVVRQLFLEGVLWFTGGAVVMVGVGVTIYVAARFSWRRWNKAFADAGDYQGKPDPFDYFLSWGLFLLAAAVIVIGVGAESITKLLWLLNPEYAALERLISVVTP